VVDNLSTHSATDVLLFALAHPRWEFVFQPKYAAYLNLIEPLGRLRRSSHRGIAARWWKVLRSLALKGHRFETIAEGDPPEGRTAKPSPAEIEQAVQRASIGTRTSTPSSGVAGAGTAARVASALPPRPMSYSFSGCTI